MGNEIKVTAFYLMSHAVIHEQSVMTWADYMHPLVDWEVHLLLPSGILRVRDRASSSCELLGPHVWKSCVQAQPEELGAPPVDVPVAPPQVESKKRGRPKKR